MSYCRWSSDDFACDIYCYEHVGGYYAVHVAAARRVLCRPLPPFVSLQPEHAKEWRARNVEIHKIIEESSMEPIGLPHDGETFREATAGECADRLEMLRDAGYVVPEYAIEALREEA